MVDELAHLETADPDTFAGVTYNTAKGVATVRFATRAGESHARKRVSAIAKNNRYQRYGRSWRVDFSPAQHSWRELSDVQRRITADRSWQPAGTTLSSWSIDVGSNVVSVGAVEVTPELRAAATRTFGTLVELHAAPLATAQSRAADWEPWSGGAVIGVPGGSCTSGFPVRNDSGDQLMVTAGHCAGLGDNIDQNGTWMGRVVLQDFSNFGYDYALFRGTSYTNFTYTTSDLGAPITAAGSSMPDGLQVCTDGAVTGENCAGVVRGQEGCIAYSDGHITCGVVTVHSSNGSALSRGGDSGGPVYTGNSSGLTIQGIILGGIEEADGGARVTYVHTLSHLVPAGYAPITG